MSEPIKVLDQKPESSREFLVFAPLYVWLSFISYSLKIWLTPAWSTTLASNHAALLEFQYTNNEQSRLLQFYVPEIFHRLFGVTIPHSYALSRLLFVFLTFVFFHRFLRKWFTVGESVAGVALCAAGVSFTHTHDLQESAPLLTLLFLLALQAIRDNRIGMLLIVFFVGGLTNETMMILPSIYFFYHLKWGSLKQLLVLAGKSFLIGLPLIITLGCIRYATRHRPVLGGGYHWPDNLHGIFVGFLFHPLEYPYSRYILFALLLAVPVYYALLDYGQKPLFVRRALWVVPLFILAHLTTGIIRESRQMIPLLLILVPTAMFTLFNKGPCEEAKP